MNTKLKVYNLTVYTDIHTCKCTYKVHTMALSNRIESIYTPVTLHEYFYSNIKFTSHLLI